MLFALTLLALAVSLSARVGKAETIPVIAVAEFEGEEHNLSAAITDTFTNDLAASPKLRLVERAQLRHAEEQLGLSQTGMIDPQNAPQLGKMVAANKVVVGSFHVVGTAVSINAHLVDVESGAIDPGMVASVQGNIAGRVSDVFRLAHQLADRFHRALTGEWLSPEASDPRADPLRVLRAGQESIAVTVSVNKGEGATYRAGERLTITFSAAQDCYVHVFNVDAAGTVTLLYPNQWERGGRVEANQTYTIPPPGAPWYLNIEGVPGQEAIVAIATKNPIDFEAIESVTDFVGKSVKPRLDETSPGDWGAAQVRFYTEIDAPSLAQVVGKYIYVPAPLAASAKGLEVAPEVELENGEEALLLGKYAEARQHFEKALRHNPRLLPALDGMGRALFFMGASQEALGYFQAALAEAERLPPGTQGKEALTAGILFNLGMAQRAVEDYQACVSSLRRFLTLEAGTDPTARQQAEMLLASLSKNGE